MPTPSERRPQNPVQTKTAPQCKRKSRAVQAKAEHSANESRAQCKRKLKVTVTSNFELYWFAVFVCTGSQMNESFSSLIYFPLIFLRLNGANRPPFERAFLAEESRNNRKYAFPAVS